VPHGKEEGRVLIFKHETEHRELKVGAKPTGVWWEKQVPPAGGGSQPDYHHEKPLEVRIDFFQKVIALVGGIWEGGADFWG